MTLHWLEAWQAIRLHPLFGLGLTLISYKLGLLIYHKTRKHSLATPIIGALALLIPGLLLLGMPFDKYFSSNQPLYLLLGPLTVALAVPLYVYVTHIKRILAPILLVILVGGGLAAFSAMAISWGLDASQATVYSTATKSITTPIAMTVAQTIGGIPALAAVIVMITGVIGGLAGIPLMKLCGINDDRIWGVALGLSAHAIGTARAMEISARCGAFAALAMSITGILTALLLPLLIHA